jgi:LCP family protein required for cell wall assembly
VVIIHNRFYFKLKAVTHKLKWYTGHYAMDENRHFKRPKAQPASIDGFVSGNRQLGQPIDKRGNSYTPNRGKPTPSLDNLIVRSDGFHPTTAQSSYGLGKSPEASETEALLDEPIVLDDEIETKDRKQPTFGKHSRRRRAFKRTAQLLLALFLVGAGFFGVKLYLTSKHLFHGGGRAPALAEDISKLKGEGDGRVNILLLGVGGPGHEGADLTDTILLVSIDPVNHTTAMLSIPRDLWVKIPGDGYQKVNAAYVYGKQQSKAKSETGKDQDGLKLLDKTLSPVIGIPIHYHAVVNFQAFKQTVDSLGGVSFYVPETLYDPTIAWENHGNSYIAMKGNQSFNGAKALLYARSRETSSDFARGERQRQLMIAIKDKAFSVGTFSNPVKVSGLLSSLGGNVYTDFSLNDIMRLYQIMGKTTNSGITSLDLVTPPHNLLTTGNMNGLSIVQPRDGLFEYGGINNYVRNALKDGFIAKENAQVAVYNATDTVGLATKQGNVLKSYGYNVTTVSSTTNSTNPPTTKIIDLSNGKNKYTQNYLQERFNTKATGSLPTSLGITPPQGTSFVIILGEDVANSQQN